MSSIAFQRSIMNPGRYSSRVPKTIFSRHTLQSSCPIVLRHYSSANASAEPRDPIPSPGVFSRVASAVKSTFTTGSFSTPATEFGSATTWNEALKEAEALVVEKKGGPIIDTKDLVGDDLKDLKNNIRNLLGSGHPMLDTVSKYYFQADGKHIRPLLILLMAQATSLAPKRVHVSVKDSYEEIDTPISELSNFHIPTLHDNKLSTSDGSHSVNPIYAPRINGADQTYILPSQRRLGEIVEMIHTASLLHDDVIDRADTRRNLLSANESFGNKMAVLGGDFLLARASIALARLRNHEVTELISTVIANLVEGEFMQLRNGQVENGKSNRPMTTFEYYMEKTYMKTASLISKSCRSSAVLGGATSEVCDIAYVYGKNIGLAFQLTDDMLDFTSSSEDFGKPAGADLKLGLATAPVLFAWEEYPELGKLIKRNFDQEGDVETAWNLVLKSKGLSQTRLLAQYHCKKAIDAISLLPDSLAKTALIQLTEKVVDRKK